MYPGVLAVSIRKYVYDTLPTLIIVSGVFQYFRNSDVLGFIADAKKAFADAELVFDATNTKRLEFANKYVRKTGNASALMHCAIDDPAAFARETGCELVEVRPFYAAVRRILKSKAGLYTRIAMAVTDRTGRAFILHVKLWPGTHADEAIRPREDGGTEPLPTLIPDAAGRRAGRRLRPHARTRGGGARCSVAPRQPRRNSRAHRSPPRP